MSQQFHLGDVCVLVLTGRDSQYNGMECTVASELRLGRGSRSGRVAYRHKIICADGEEWFAEPHQLRLKRPPEEPKSDFTPCDEDFSEWFNNVRSVEKCR